MSRLLEFNPNLRPNLRRLLDAEWFSNTLDVAAGKPHSPQVNLSRFHLSSWYDVIFIHLLMAQNKQ